MISGIVPKANRVLEVIYLLNESITTTLIDNVDKELCTKGKTKKHAQIAIYNSLLVYLSLIYTDINTNTLAIKDEDYYKCKYNWATMVNYYGCLNYNLEVFATTINLFTKQPTDTITVNCY